MPEKVSKIFAIHGGGNIGLGLMAEVVEKSHEYRIVASSNDVILQKIVNATHQVNIRHHHKTTQINNVDIVPRDFNNIVNLYQNADKLAICLTPDAVKNSVEEIAVGLTLRAQSQKPLEIFVLMNLPDCAEFVKDLVKQKILEHCHFNKAETDRILKNIKFIPTIIDRVVTKIPNEDVMKQIKQCVLRGLEIDFVTDTMLDVFAFRFLDNPNHLAMAARKLGFHCHFFDAEQSYALYIPANCIDDKLFPEMKRVHDIKQFEAVKNKFINGPHAMVAWLGALFGCNTIAEAISFPGIKNIVDHVMEHEIKPALMTAYPNLKAEELDQLKKTFMERCIESKMDSVHRVGRAPLRKLNLGERIQGVIELCNKNAKQKSSLIELAIAAGILYGIQTTEADKDCTIMKTVFQKSSSYEDVLYYQGSCSSGNFAAFNRNNFNDMKRVKRIGSLITHLLYLQQQLKMGKQIKLSIAALNSPLILNLSLNTPLTSVLLFKRLSQALSPVPNNDIDLQPVASRSYN